MILKDPTSFFEASKFFNTVPRQSSIFAEKLEGNKGLFPSQVCEAGIALP